jgi:hypothetical protein
MSDELVVLRIESEETKARIEIGFLQSCGIDAQILEDDAGDQLPQLESIQGVKILVPQSQAQRALELLQEREQSAEEDDDADDDTDDDIGN